VKGPLLASFRPIVQAIDIAGSQRRLPLRCQAVKGAILQYKKQCIATIGDCLRSEERGTPSEDSVNVHLDPISDKEDPA
jgi:hypothetical protein